MSQQIDISELTQFIDRPLVMHTMKCIQQAVAGVDADVFGYDVTIQPFLGSDASNDERLEVQEFIYKLRDLGLFTLGPLSSLGAQEAPPYSKSYLLTNIDSKLYVVIAMLQSATPAAQPFITVRFADGQLNVGDYKSIKIQSNSRIAAVLSALLQHTEPHKEWSWDEIAEVIGESPDNTELRDKIYKAGYDLNTKCAHFNKPLLIQTSYTIQLNPAYTPS